MPTEESPDLAILLPSWQLALRAERKSPQTVKSYTDGVRRFLTWAEETGTPAVLDKPTVNAFTVDLIDQGAEGATVRSRQLGVRRFSAWLAEEGEIPADQLVGIKPPKLDQKTIHPLDEDQIKALIKACQGTDYRDRRDEALVRFLVETGARAGEVIAIQVADVDLNKGIAVVRRGKGAKGRLVPFGSQTARAIDRYIRVRRTHRLADSPALWLGDRNRGGLSYYGLHWALKGRAAAAGIEGFHPHRLRHTMADRWLSAGGSEGGLMSVAGWSQPDMLMRYTRARASERAAAEARALNLGDL